MEKIEQVIGYEFKNKDYLSQSFTHSSYAYEHSLACNNERLEFLGDAVLEMIASLYLYNKFSQMTEGDLTKLRAAAVCELSLAKAARRIDLGGNLKLGRGEDLGGGRERDSVLADAMEALIGAVYLDGGFDCAQALIIRLLSEYIEQIGKTKSFGDYKTQLQEILQKNSKEQIVYKIIGEQGPAHNKLFTAGVYSKGNILGTGEGKNKKEAEQQAAYDALQKL